MLNSSGDNKYFVLFLTLMFHLKCEAGFRVELSVFYYSEKNVFLFEG